SGGDLERRAGPESDLRGQRSGCVGEAVTSIPAELDGLRFQADVPALPGARVARERNGRIRADARAGPPTADVRGLHGRNGQAMGAAGGSRGTVASLPASSTAERAPRVAFAPPSPWTPSGHPGSEVHPGTPPRRCR